MLIYPTPNGGISGKLLKPLSLTVCKFVSQLRDIKMLIGGGGVTCQQDIDDYHAVGATDVSITSYLFFFWKWPEIKRLAQVESLRCNTNSMNVKTA